MATTVSLISQVRRYVRDWPQLDAITASIASNGTVATVATTAGAVAYTVNKRIQIDQEAMLIRSLASGTTLGLFRGANGTTAASHASGSTLMLSMSFLDQEILDALNYAKDLTFPYLYQEIVDTSLTTSANTYEYTIPSMSSPSLVLPYINEVELKESGFVDYRKVRSWTVKRGTTPKLQFFHEPYPSSTIRLRGYGPFPDLTIAGSTDTKFPPNAANCLVLGAVEYLLSSGESARVRVDMGLVDQRENANRVGSSLNASNALQARFLRALSTCAMSPMPKTVQSVF